MNKFVHITGTGAGVVDSLDPHRAKGDNDTAILVKYHNGIKITAGFFEPTSLTEITAAEFEQSVRRGGHTSMLRYLVSTEIEAIVWHTDPKDLPEPNKRCLLVVVGGVGAENRAVWTGSSWRGNDGFHHQEKWIKAWAYEPKGPKS